MYRSLTIENYRAFERLQLNDLRLINLFVGPNNCGKTSVLEAAAWHAAGPSLPSPISVLRSRMGRFRGAEDLGEALKQLFHRPDVLEFRIEATLEPGDDRPDLPLSHWARTDKSLIAAPSFAFQMQPTSALSALFPGQRLASAPPFPEATEESEFRVSVPQKIVKWKFEAGGYVHESWINSSGRADPVEAVFQEHAWADVTTHRDRRALMQQFVNLLRSDRVPELLEPLQKIFPEVVSIEPIPLPSGGMGNLYVRTRAGDRLEISAFGEGLRRWLELLLGILDRPAVAAIFADEIDAALHPYLEPVIARELVSLLKRQRTQLFASTHNIEFIDGLLGAVYDGVEAMPEDEDLVAIYTLRRGPDGKHTVRRRHGWEALQARAELRAELRA